MITTKSDCIFGCNGHQKKEMTFDISLKPVVLSGTRTLVRTPIFDLSAAAVSEDRTGRGGVLDASAVQQSLQTADVNRTFVQCGNSEKFRRLQGFGSEWSRWTLIFAKCLIVPTTQQSLICTKPPCAVKCMNMNMNWSFSGDCVFRRHVVNTGRRSETSFRSGVQRSDHHSS